MANLDKFTEAAFHEWLSAQPADRRFNYASIWDCMFSSWLKETGVGGPGLTCSPFGFNDWDAGECHTFPPWLETLDRRVRHEALVRSKFFTVANVRQLFEPNAQA